MYPDIEERSARDIKKLASNENRTMDFRNGKAVLDPLGELEACDRKNLVICRAT
jgi:hypothetical protein